MSLRKVTSRQNGVSTVDNKTREIANKIYCLGRADDTSANTLERGHWFYWAKCMFAFSKFLKLFVFWRMDEPIPGMFVLFWMQFSSRWFQIWSWNSKFLTFFEHFVKFWTRCLLMPVVWKVMSQDCIRPIKNHMFSVLPFWEKKRKEEGIFIFLLERAIKHLYLSYSANRMMWDYGGGPFIFLFWEAGPSSDHKTLMQCYTRQFQSFWISFNIWNIFYRTSYNWKPSYKIKEIWRIFKKGGRRGR